MIRRILILAAFLSLVPACGGSDSEAPSTTALVTTSSTITTTQPVSATSSTTTTLVVEYPYVFIQDERTPLIEPGEWDSTYTAVPHVIKEGDEWLMFYAGGTGGRNSALGLARSPDGLTWEKDPNEILYNGPGNRLAWNYAQKVGDEWVMWFTSGFRIGYREFKRATAPAPEGPWELDDLEIEPPFNEWDDRILPTGFVQIGETFYLPYAGFPDGVSPPAVGLFTSSDGINWESTPEPIYAPGPGTWTEFGVVPTNVFETPAGLEMFFLGFDRPASIALEDDTLKLGRLVSTDGGDTWEVDNDGMPVADTFEQGWPGISVVYIDGEYRLYMGHELGGAGIALVTGQIP